MPSGAGQEAIGVPGPPREGEDRHGRASQHCHPHHPSIQGLSTDLARPFYPGPFERWRIGAAQPPEAPCLLLASKKMGERVSHAPLGPEQRRGWIPSPPPPSFANSRKEWSAGGAPSRLPLCNSASHQVLLHGHESEAHNSIFSPSPQWGIPNPSRFQPLLPFALARAWLHVGGGDQ